MWSASFKKLFFSSTIIKWNKLDFNIYNSETLITFKTKTLKFVKPSANSIFGWHKPIGVKLLTRLGFRQSDLCEHEFKDSFQDTLNPVSSSGKEHETTFHFLRSCSNYSDERLTLLSKIGNINPNILKNTSCQITQFFLYGDKNFTASTDFISLSSTIENILATKRLHEPLFH